MRTKDALLASLVAVLFVAAPALAWESICVEYPDRSLAPASLDPKAGVPCEPASGPNTARHRWVGTLDEHRLLWEEARIRGGLPDSLSAPMTLELFTAEGQVPIGSEAAPTLIPAPFTEASRVQTRTLSLGELTQLPDFSYALWDWATGHETCPLPGVGVDAEKCHDFATHMGPVNSNHFLPQAARFYERYHVLALQRAGACRQLHDALGSDVSRFRAYVLACEQQALALEAVGQHYLQDAWSAGHMWERWGSPELSGFEGANPEGQRERAVLVALVSGMIHGSRGVLQRLPQWTSYDVNDAMCAPHPDVAFVTPDGMYAAGVGDDYLGELATRSAQSERFYSCAVSGLLEVYDATAKLHGAVRSGTSGWTRVDPLGPGCFGQRATNRAILTGMGIQLRLAGQQLQFPLDGKTVSWMVPTVAKGTGEVEVSSALKNRFRLELLRMVSVSRVVAKDRPAGTELASGRLGTFLGAKPNGAYANGPGPIATYLEPALPWPDTADASPEGAFRAASLARLFHRAHAADWCRLTTEAELAALRSRAADETLSQELRSAACGACTEISMRHLRVGDASSWDTSREPLCAKLSSSAAVIYAPGTPGREVEEVAREWCGC
ncbi:MAG: hypothetical protein WBV82_17435 [Myxococcaceae bacterium]